MGTDLKPCPFCGAQPETVDVQAHGVVCPSCGVEGALGYEDGRISAIAGWNRRAAAMPEGGQG